MASQQRSLFIAVAILIAAAIGAYIFVQQEQGGISQDEITIGTFSKAVDYGPLYIAKHFKWFDQDNGRKVRFREFNDRKSIQDEALAGNLHVILAAMPPLAITRASGVDISIVEVSCTLQQEILVRSSLAINSASDLRGQRLAVLKATSSHYGLLKTLQSVGLSQNDVKISFLGPIDARSKFEAGQIDAWAVWPPFVEEQQLANRGKVVPGGGAVIQSVVSMDDSFLKESESDAKSILSEIRRAKVWMLDHPEEAQAIVAKEMKLNPDVVELAWGKHDWGARLDSEFLEDVNAKISFLAEQDLMRAGYENRLTGFVTTTWGGNTALR